MSSSNPGSFVISMAEYRVVLCIHHYWFSSATHEPKYTDKHAEVTVQEV